MIDHAIYLAALLFALGFVTLLVRRNVLFMLLAVEIMLNAAGMVFVAGGARWGQADGQVIFLLVLAAAAAAVAVGLALVLRLQKGTGSLDADSARSLGGG